MSASPLGAAPAPAAEVAPAPSPGSTPAPAAPDSGGLTEEEAAELAAFSRDAAETADLAAEAAEAATPAAGSQFEPAPAPEPQSVQAGSVLSLGRAAAAAAGGPPANNKRKNGRLAAQDAHTALGEVMDISGSGMRIRRRGAKPVSVGDTFLLDLYVCGRAVRLPVEVVRIQKAGWRSHDYGLRFGELPPEMRAQFGMLARMAAKHVSIA